MHWYLIAKCICLVQVYASYIHLSKDQLCDNLPWKLRCLETVYNADKFCYIYVEVSFASQKCNMMAVVNISHNGFSTFPY